MGILQILASQIVLAGVVAATDFSHVDADLVAYDQTIERMRSEFAQKPAQPKDPDWVKAKLKNMVEVDQFMRKQWRQLPSKYSEDAKKYFFEKFQPRFSDMDTRNTGDLKDLLKIHRWFTISTFGKDADSHAWLIVQHADLDLEFQKHVLSILAELYPSRETNPKNYAFLVDRVAAAWSYPDQRTLQTYGTQGECVGPKKWKPIPMIDPENVDARRAQVGLPSMAEYYPRVSAGCP